MAKEYAKAFYKSKKWQRCRASYIAERKLIDGGMCEHCKKRLGSDVDHVEEITEASITDPNVTLNPENLQLLCKVCHNRKTRQGQPGYVFDEAGRPISL
ncbi:MAG: HNH endonuclease [Clostridiaceae bacterium]|nr:HNH endonuclease [Clostridiaceae bacterium]